MILKFSIIINSLCSPCILERVLLLRAALTQLTNNEASIAADPETSPILERLVYSMDDFARRVLIDRFTGQYVLSRHFVDTR